MQVYELVLSKYIGGNIAGKLRFRAEDVDSVREEISRVKEKKLGFTHYVIITGTPDGNIIKNTEIIEIGKLK
jgi:hypothetical protein